MNVPTCKWADHERFHFLHEHGANRPITPSHVEVMEKAIDLMGVIRPVVVAKISFLAGRTLDYVVDGQHLLTALVNKKMDIPYVYIEKKIATYEELVRIVSLLNTSSKSWTLTNYVEVWAAAGKRSYTKLKRYQLEYKLPYSTLCMALNSNAMHRVTDKLKTGKFSIQDEQFAISTIEKITDIFSVLKGARSEQRVLVQSYIKFYKSSKSTYNHSKFMTALKNHRTQVAASLSNIPECTKTIKNIYQRFNAKGVSVVGKSGLKNAS